MTDRYNTLTVALERDIREDDAEALLTAIRMLRGVLSVSGNVADNTSFVAEARARKEWTTRISDLLREDARRQWEA